MPGCGGGRIGCGARALGLKRGIGSLVFVAWVRDCLGDGLSAGTAGQPSRLNCGCSAQSCLPSLSKACGDSEQQYHDKENA